MWTATWKSLIAHKLRLALTALAVVLGVGFVSATYVLGDTINHSLDSSFTQVAAGKDAVVKGKSAFTTSGFDAETSEPVPASVLDRVKTVPGVANAEGVVEGQAYVVGKDGKPVKNGFVPTFGFSFIKDPKLATFTIASGRGPVKAGEVAIDKKTVDKGGYKVGDQVTVVTETPHQVTIVGIVKAGSSDNLAGAGAVLFDSATAEAWMDKAGRFDAIDVRAAGGTSSQEVKTNLIQALGSDVKVQTGIESGQETAKQIGTGFAMFTTFFRIFGYIALFVGTFIIINTFSILVAQRTRELALLRALGASKAQVRGSVLAEAAVTGIVASLIGVGFGIFAASGLKALFNSFGGGSLSTANLLVKPGALIVPFVLGVVITCLASALPARKASAVQPVAAMRDAVSTEDDSLVRRSIVAGLVLLIGVGVLAAGLFAGAGILTIGIGAALTFVGVTLLVPLFARPLSRVLGAPVAALGPAARLGRSNAMRSPRRTASTASALVVGLALVGAVTTMAASFKASFTSIVDASIHADYVVEGNQGSAVSSAAAAQVRALPAVASAAALTNAPMQLNGVTKTIGGIDANGFDLVNLDLKQGSASALAKGQLLVDENVASRNHFTVGEQLQAVFPRSGATNLTVGAIYKANPLPGSYLLSNEVLNGKTNVLATQVVLVKAKPGQLAAVRPQLDGLAKDFPDLKVRDQAQFKKQQSQQIDTALSFVLVLLALSIIIAVVGIVNTLALSVVERTRELGLMRAVGMQRRQVTRMVRSEAVIIASLGSVVGLVVGIALARALLSALSSSGINTFSLPAVQLLEYLVVAALFGVLAAIWPARRANKLNVLKAIATE